MPSLRDQNGSRHTGNLFTRSSSPVWEYKHWKLSSLLQQLWCFESEASEQPIATLNLRGGQIHEIKLQPAGRQMHSSAILLKASEHDPTSATNGGGERSTDASSLRPVEYLLAAEDGITHSTWQRHLQKAISGAEHAAPTNKQKRSMLAQRKRTRASSVFGPSPLVVARLCGTGQEFGKGLLQRFRAARRTFEEGLRDLTVVADKARLAQRGLYDVDGLLLTISRTLADSHCPEEQSAADAEALGLCRDWIAGLRAFVMDLDQQVETMLQREGVTQLPANWCTLAQNSIMQIRDLEDAMQFGQSQWLKLHAAKPCGSGSPVAVQPLRCATTPRSCMPYGSHWARATAI